ncbi:MAG TPA: hypothetical protein PKY88_00810 [Anaerohalosphaeraceae bacterium]|nr:hypothetical protein [Anaerohalosphaeraceae bacterium]
MGKYYTVLLTLVFVGFGCTRHKNNGSPVRPSDFPAFLNAPETASRIRYATPENADIIEGAYSLSYFVEEPFPPRNTMSYVQNELSSAGFFRLKYLLYSRTEECSYGWYSNKHTEPGFIYLEWTERWGHPEKDECVTVYFCYRYKPPKKDLTTLYVTLIYSTERSEQAVFVKQYKESLPKEEWGKKADEIDYENMWGQEKRK